MALRTRLQELEHPPSLFEGVTNSASNIPASPPVTSASSSAEKVTLFRRLFVGRADVFPIRWENWKTGKGGYAPACANEWVKGVCNKPRVKCGECPNQAFIPVSDEIIERHLRGRNIGRSLSDDFVAGVYPLLPDQTCWFLAVDFDKENWAADALAVLETCLAKNVPAALERSRSGNGGHGLDFLFRARPRAPGPSTRRAINHCDHGASSGDRLRFVRSLLSKPRRDADRRVWKSDRPSVAARGAGEGQQPFRRQEPSPV